MNTSIVALLLAMLVVSFAQKKGPGGDWAGHGTRGRPCLEGGVCMSGLCCLTTRNWDAFLLTCQPLRKVGQTCSPQRDLGGAFKGTCPCSNVHRCSVRSALNEANPPRSTRGESH
ncbi:U-scoloptoxin(18)-Er1a-like [Ixodes scapularis]